MIVAIEDGFEGHCGLSRYIAVPGGISFNVERERRSFGHDCKYEVRRARALAENSAALFKLAHYQNFTCLDKFFNGTGLNVVANLLNPTTLLNSIESQICNKLTQVWSQTIGKAQCGITLTGFQMGFLGGSTLGGGLSCPKISIGGGGPTIMSIGVGPTNSGKLTVTGNAVAPTGYSITSLLGLF